MLIIRQEECVQSNWTNGTSTQWLIYPSFSTLEKRDFIFRISTATVKSERSVFTNFESYNRFLIPISGQLNLEHQLELGTFTQPLKPFQLGRFDGSWKTKAEGFVSDFNFIIQKNIAASVQLIEIQENKKNKPVESQFKVFFLATGVISFLGEEISAPCLFQLDENDEFTVTAVYHSKIIAVSLNNIAF